jgi:hypothetical protein
VELKFIEIKEAKLFSWIIQIWNGDKDGGVILLIVMIEFKERL